MNELLDIAKLLGNEYGEKPHWEITSAEQLEPGKWVLNIQNTDTKKKTGAKNDSNK